MVMMKVGVIKHIVVMERGVIVEVVARVKSALMVKVMWRVKRWMVSDHMTTLCCRREGRERRGLRERQQEEAPH